MYKVIREIHFSYGHRLLNYEGKCAYLHGHNGRVQIEVSTSSLNDQNMVVDFYEIKAKMEKWIDEVLDHKMILWEKDPLVKILRDADQKVVTMPENPTAEAIAKWIFSEAKNQGLPVSQVRLWETENCCAAYVGDGE